MTIKHSLRLLNLIFAVILLLLSSFFLIELNDSLKRIEIFAFLEDNIDKQRIEEVKEALKAFKKIKSVHFSHPDETVKVWAGTLSRKKILEVLGENPFPPLFQIKLKKVEIKELRELTDALKKVQGITVVEYGGKRTEEGMRRTKQYIFASLFVFFAALINILDHLFIVRNEK